MKHIYILVLILFYQIGFSQACVLGAPSKVQQYVCYDGRTLKRQDRNYIWHARRGCFKSTVPCCAYQAEHYTQTRNQSSLAIALFRCQENYPFRLGEMQTH